MNATLRKVRLAGLAAVVPLVTALAMPSGPAPAALTPIKHVVVIYLENQSFDSLLGFWCRANPGRCPDGGMPPSVTLSDGTVVTPATASDLVPQVAHDVSDQLAAIDGGKMDGWQNVPGCQAPAYACISGYEPSQIPNITALARKFAISDETFSLADSPSWGGHLAIALGTLDGFTGGIPQPKAAGPGWGCDSHKTAVWKSPLGVASQQPSCIPDFSLNPVKYPYGGAFQLTKVSYVPSIFDRLNAAGLSWRLFGASATQTGYIWSICPSLAECLDTPAQFRNLVPDDNFITAAHKGTLPAFSIVTPGGDDFFDSCHNGTVITACGNWTGKLVSAVMSGPDWASTAIFITWDDCGCFYDQVAPGKSPDGNQEGPRVPLIIVSPFARPGFTDTKPTTFAGILAYTEHNFGLAPLGVNDAKAYPFTGAFNYSQAPLRPVRMVTRPLPGWAKRLAAHLPAGLLNDPT